MMSNLLNVAMIQSILSLNAQGWSQRRIARTLGVDRETVRRQILANSKPANAPVGSGAADEAKAPISPIGSPVNAPIGAGPKKGTQLFLLTPIGGRGSLRAGLVKRAEDWRWSSLWRDKRGRSSFY